MPTIKDIIAKVREIATARPDVVYTGDNGCFYNKGTCNDGTLGCLFGQVFKEFGLTIFDDEDHGSAAAVLVERFELEGTSDEFDWCDQVQRRQDCGDSWSKAVSNADTAYPLN